MALACAAYDTNVINIHERFQEKWELYPEQTNTTEHSAELFLLETNEFMLFFIRGM